MPLADYEFRAQVVAGDVMVVRDLVRDSGFFSHQEQEIAAELVEERLHNGSESGYDFLFAQSGTRVAGYTCYGRIPMTESSFDLYWIVVDRQQQGRGLGRLLLKHTEWLIHESGGRRLYAETSSRPQYSPTQAFYQHTGYHEAAYLEDFYAPGDGKLIYSKSV